MISNGIEKPEGLVEIKRSTIQKTLPKWDEDLNQAVEGSSREQNKMFRCPQCGMAVIPKKIDDPQAAIDRQLQELEIAKQIEADRQMALQQAEDAFDKRREAQQAEFAKRRKK